MRLFVLLLGIIGICGASLGSVALAEEVVIVPPMPAAGQAPAEAPPNLAMFAGQLIRVTRDAVVIRHHGSGEQKTLQRAGIPIKDLVVGDEITVQYAPDREALVTIQKTPPPTAPSDAPKKSAP